MPTGEHLDPVAAATVAEEGWPARTAPTGRLAPPPPDPGLRFTEVSAIAGVDFSYTFGDFAYDNILESSGSGASWFDADGDGDLDLFLANGTYIDGVSDPKGRVFAGSRDAFYRNEGQGRFVEAGRAAGLGDEIWSMAAMSADYDGDGDLDLFLANYGPNRLYRNDGGGRFTDVAAEVGLVGPEQLNGFVKWSVGGSWFDLEGDGDLDLVVCNFLAFDPYYLHPGKPWQMPDPKEYRGQASLLYRHEADGRFTEITRQAGVYRPDSKCMGITVLDFDGDGRLDFFQGNDHQPNFLFRNRGDGSFEDLGWRSGVAVNDAGIGTGSMHGSPGDIDGDGLLDLLVVDLRHGSLYRQREPLLYEDVTAASGVGRLLDGLDQWGAGLHDFDNDGDVDLFTTNGIAHILVAQPPMLAVNDGKGRFSDARAFAGAYFRSLRSGRGAAFADYDDDGDLDIVVNHVDHQATVALLRNDTPRRGGFIGFELKPTAGSSAVGATVTVYAGGRQLVRALQPVTSYLSQNDPRLHFGLGDAERLERVVVHWPGRGRESWTGEALSIGRYWTLVEGSGSR